LPMQPGDVPATAANTDELDAWVGFKPNTAVPQGVARFVDWYRNYYTWDFDPEICKESFTYAAVVPKWIAALLAGKKVYINGDGETSRDFCYIENVVQINLLAAITENAEARNQVYNVAMGDRTTFNELYKLLLDGLTKNCRLPAADLVYRDFRAGDVRHSQADIGKAQRLLGYAPTHRIGEGVQAALGWYIKNQRNLEGTRFWKQSSLPVD
jgi:nucleoside-diphosphate-sugar epimerase